MDTTDKVIVKEVTIASGTATSGYIDVRGAKRIRIRVPSAWDAADISFMAKEANTTKPNLRASITAAKVRNGSAGTLFKITSIVTNEAAWYSTELSAMSAILGCPWLALRSTNTASEADVNQTADRVIQVAITY